MNEIDVAALALVLAFGYKGYRSGLIGMLLGLTSGLLAFGLAAVLAPLLAPAVSPLLADRLGVPAAAIRPALVVGLTIGLRLVLGAALRQLVSVVRMLIHGVPPLALADRLLGIVPGAALGGLIAVGVVLLALLLPDRFSVQRQVEESWLARNVIAQPRQTAERVRDLGERLLTDPPRVNGFVLGAGAAGMAAATLAAGQLRGPARAAAFREAPTRRIARAGMAETEVADPLAWVRATLGISIALAMAAALLLFIGAR